MSHEPRADDTSESPSRGHRHRAALGSRCPELSTIPDRWQNWKTAPQDEISDAV